MPEVSGAKIRSVELETVCGLTSVIPSHDVTEAAFAGRSNAGKSSLINALVERKALARTSGSPGKTRTINYYRVNAGETREDFAPDSYLVDLPGYGYADISESVKKKWGGMIEGYLRTSSALRLVFLLVDIRHEPTKDDCMMFDWIVSSGLVPVVVATKKDKIKKSQLQKQTSLIRRTLGASADVKIIPFSAVTKEGRLEIWDEIRSSEGGIPR